VIKEYPLPGTVGGSPAQGRGSIGERGIVGERGTVEEKRGYFMAVANRKFSTPHPTRFHFFIR
jgi:hypothetical protein